MTKMKSLLEILRTDDSAVASLPASPGKRGPGSATEDFRRGRRLGERVAKARLEHSYERIIDAEREYSKKWRLRAKVAEGELRATRLTGCVTDAMIANAIRGYRDAIDPDHRDTQWRSDETMLGIVTRGVRGAIEAVVTNDLAQPAAGGASSLKDLATRNALIAVLKQCDLELERCEDEKCAVCLLAFCIQEIAEKAYYETVGRGGEDDGDGALADARGAAAQEGVCAFHFIAGAVWCGQMRGNDIHLNIAAPFFHPFVPRSVPAGKEARP